MKSAMSAAKSNCVPDGRIDADMPYPALEPFATRLFNGRDIAILLRHDFCIRQAAEGLFT